MRGAFGIYLVFLKDKEFVYVVGNSSQLVFVLFIKLAHGDLLKHLHRKIEERTKDKIQ